MESLIQRQLERDRLREIIDDAETERGEVDNAAVEAKRAVLRSASAGPDDAHMSGTQVPDAVPK